MIARLRLTLLPLLGCSITYRALRAMQSPNCDGNVEEARDEYAGVRHCLGGAIAVVEWQFDACAIRDGRTCETPWQPVAIMISVLGLG
jgi:hypothetical protein